jgi:phosphoribosylamine--glycine ligase
MGAASPPSGFDPAAQEAAMDVFIRPALAEMARRGTPFRGFLFAGLMLTPDGPKLIEYNVRFGDPEAQTLLPRLQSDLLPALVAACDGELANFRLMQRSVACVAVVMAARGYPGTYAKGGVISGLERAAATPHVAVFHAGTDVRDGSVVANGGRVLTVCGTGETLQAARDAAYRGVAAIEWSDGMFRTDIGLRSIRAALAGMRL